MYEPSTVIAIGFLVFIAAHFTNLWKTVDPILWAALLYSALHIVWDINQSQFTTRFVLSEAKWMLAFDHQSYAALSTILLGSSMLLVRSDWVPHALRALCVGNLIITFISMLFRHPGAHPGWITGIALTPAINLAIGIVTAPFFKFKWRIPLTIVYGLLAIKANSSTAILALAASWVPAIPLRFSIPSILITFVGGHFFVPAWYGSERWQDYLFFFERWRENFSFLFGAGVNHFAVWGPYFQSKAGTVEVWAALHSDWFQVLFEQGILGLILWGAVGVNLLWQSWRKDPVIAQSSLSWMVMAAFYFPAQTTIMTLIGIMIVLRSLLVFHWQRDEGQQSI